MRIPTANMQARAPTQMNHRFALPPPTATQPISTQSQMTSGSSQPAPQYWYYPCTACSCQLHQTSAGSASSQIDNQNSSTETGTNSIIDPDTPKYVAEIILDAIAVEPYNMEGNEARSPESFVEHFEVYANLLNLNAEQKRVLFAGLAYMDNSWCFEALKRHATFDIMKTKFIEVATRIRRNSIKFQMMMAARNEKKPGLLTRVCKWFRK